MTPEERFERIERQLEFLANHQAELFASLESLKEADQRHSEQIAQHTAQIGQLADLVLRIGRIVEEQGRRTDGRLESLAQAQQRTDEQLESLAQAQQRTDERLNALLSVVERYFSDGRH